jgi:hypothetical protein
MKAMALNLAQTELNAIRLGHGAPFASQGQVKTEDKAFAAADIIAAVIQAAAGTSVPYQSSQGTQILYKGFDAKRRKSDVAVKPNPWFTANGHEGESPVTQAYLFTRAWKSAAGTGVSLVGSLLSSHTGGVNAGSIARHGSAFGTTSAHLLAVKAIASANKKTETIARWCDVIIRAKAAKAALRGTQLAGAATPVPLVGALVNIAAAAGKLGIKVGLPEMCYLVAIEIHWRAFQEQVIGGGFSKTSRKIGPASRIFSELFTRRGLTAIGGSYDVSALMREPAGWMVLGDKLARE